MAKRLLTVQAISEAGDFVGLSALLVLSYTRTGSVLGPAVGGPLLGWKPDAVWPFAAAVCLFSALACLRIERLLPERVRRTPLGAHVEPEPAVPGEGVPAGSAG